MVSLYHFLGRKQSHRRHRMVAGMSFDEYLRWELGRGKRTQHAFITDRHCRVLVDFVGRFERLEEDFALVCRHLGIEAQLPPRTHTLRDYTGFYDQSRRDLVAEHLKTDIELFGYSFDDWHEVEIDRRNAETCGPSSTPAN